MGKVWVVTGPMGSGKSTVCRLFADQGATVLDADGLSHRLMADERQVRAGLHALFGEGVFGEDGSPDRKLIGRRVFEDPALLSRLEALLHPPVLAELAEKAAEWRAGDEGLLIMEIVLWYQQASPPFPVDGILLTMAPRKRLIERVTSSRGLAAFEAERRLDSQGEWHRWTAGADRVLDTDCDLSELTRKVRALMPLLRDA